MSSSCSHDAFEVSVSTSFHMARLAHFEIFYTLKKQKSNMLMVKVDR